MKFYIVGRKRESRQKTRVDGELSLQAFGGKSGKQEIPGVLRIWVTQCTRSYGIDLCLFVFGGKKIYSEDSVDIVDVLGTI